MKPIDQVKTSQIKQIFVHCFNTEQTGRGITHKWIRQTQNLIQKQKNRTHTGKNCLINKKNIENNNKNRDERTNWGQ